MQLQLTQSGRYNPKFSAEFLDTAAALDVVQAGKRLSFDLLAIKSGSRILDIGCGTGEDAISLAKSVIPFGGHVTAIDSDHNLLQVAAARSADRGLPLHFQCADIYELPFAIATFDAVRIDRVLHFLPDPRRALASAIQATKAQGRIVVTEPDWSSFRIQSQADPDLTASILQAGVPSEGPACIGGELDSLFSRCGLEILAFHPMEVKVRSVRTAMQLFGIEKIAQRAVLSGALTAPDAVQWIRALQRSEESGEFVAILGGSTICGSRAD